MTVNCEKGVEENIINPQRNQCESNQSRGFLWDDTIHRASIMHQLKVTSHLICFSCWLDWLRSRLLMEQVSVCRSVSLSVVLNLSCRVSPWWSARWTDSFIRIGIYWPWIYWVWILIEARDTNDGHLLIQLKKPVLFFYENLEKSKSHTRTQTKPVWLITIFSSQYSNGYVKRFSIASLFNWRDLVILFFTSAK